MGEIRSTKGDIRNDDCGIICEICGRSINENAEVEVCTECVSPFHKECWDKRGGCGNPNCSSFVKPMNRSEKATANVVSVIIGKAKESLAKKEFDKALEFYKKALEYDSSNVESITGLILAENSVCSTKELLKKGIEFEKSDSYKTYVEKLPEEKKKFFEELIQNRCENQEKKKKSRKIVVISSVASALAVILVALCVWLATPLSKFKFETNNGNIVITGVINKNIRNAVIPEKIFGKPVTTIEDGAFRDCTSLTSVTIGNRVTTIGDDAFRDCTSLTSVTIGNGVNTICEHAFEGCTSLTSLTISKGVIFIYYAAFEGCTNIKELEAPSGALDSIPKDSLQTVVINGGQTLLASAFRDCTSLTSVTIGSGVTKIGHYAFEGCTSLTNVTIGNDVTTIEWYVFSGCTSLTSMVIPKSVTTIDNDAFWGCTSLTSIIVNEKNPSYKSIDGNLYSKDGETLIRYATGKNETSFVIPSGVTTIAEFAFSDCEKFTSVVIPNSVTTIDNEAFWDCPSLTSIIVNEENPSYKSIDGNLYSKDGETLIRYATGKKETSFVIPSGVTTIGEHAFDDCTSLTSVTIGNNVTSIGEGAFWGCTGLTSVVIPNSVTKIGDYTFYYCTELTSVTIGNSVTTIGYHAFEDCTSLTSVVIPDSVTKIGYYAFRDCTGLTSVTIGNGVTTIGDSAFKGCTSLTSVTIGNRVTTIDDYAFCDCTGLTSVTIGDSVTTIGYHAFEGCTYLTIYCEAESKPSDWDTHWNPSSRPVVWDSKRS